MKARPVETMTGLSADDIKEMAKTNKISGPWLQQRSQRKTGPKCFILWDLKGTQKNADLGTSKLMVRAKDMMEHWRWKQSVMNGGGGFKKECYPLGNFPRDPTFCYLSLKLVLVPKTLLILKNACAVGMLATSSLSDRVSSLLSCTVSLTER